jgi:hypothetical protein
LKSGWEEFEVHGASFDVGEYVLAFDIEGPRCMKGRRKTLRNKVKISPVISRFVAFVAYVADMS